MILLFTVVMVLVCALALATSCLEDSLWPIKAGMPEIIFNNEEFKQIVYLRI